MNPHPTSPSSATPAPQVWPTLRATDAPALIRFLVDTVGLEEAAITAEGDIVHHAQLAWPGGGGIKLGSARATQGDTWTRRPGSFGAYVVAADPAALHDRLRDAGATIHQPLGRTNYGSIEFALRDLEENLWSFGLPR